MKFPVTYLFVFGVNRSLLDGQSKVDHQGVSFTVAWCAVGQ